MKVNSTTMDDDDITDDILQLLSRPSSANRSKKNRTRKKVTFSNAVINDGHSENNLSSNSSKILVPKEGTSDKDNEEDNLRSFSRSKRVDNKYGTSVDDMNDLFGINK
jgi:hypothetical protein